MSGMSGDSKVSVMVATVFLQDERLARLLEDVVRTQRPLAVYLFGSRAEGRALPTSDYDLLVVLPDDASDEALDAGVAYESVIRAGVPGDVIPTTRKLFLAARDDLSTIEGVAATRGCLLYGSV
jgi:predicted nucleotidyltransferase